MLCWPSYGQVPTNEQPFTPDEEREILLRLFELGEFRVRLNLAVDQLERERELGDRERAVAAREIEAQKALNAAIERERDLERDKARTYKDLFDAATKKRNGIGCQLKRIFTFGLARCG